MGGGKNSVKSGSAVPATCRPAPVRRGPWMSRSPHALPAPEYRLAPRVGSVPKSRGVMQAVFPWRQGMPYGDQIASVKFSLAERLPFQLPGSVTALAWRCRAVSVRRAPVAAPMRGAARPGPSSQDKRVSRQPWTGHGLPCYPSRSGRARAVGSPPVRPAPVLLALGTEDRIGDERLPDMQATYAEQVLLRQGLREALAQRGQLQGVHLRPITDPEVRLSGCLAARQYRVKPGEP